MQLLENIDAPQQRDQMRYVKCCETYLDKLDIFLIGELGRSIIQAAWGELIFRIRDHIRVIEIGKNTH